MESTTPMNQETMYYYIAAYNSCSSEEDRREASMQPLTT